MKSSSSPVPLDRRDAPTPQTRRCRFCQEEIALAATVCKHCRRDLIPGRGSEPARDVTVRGIDPLAELHTPIKGKSAGRLTVVGYLGIGIGVLMIMAAVGTASPDRPEGVLIFGLFGLGFAVASFLWARRQ